MIDNDGIKKAKKLKTLKKIKRKKDDLSLSLNRS